MHIKKRNPDKLHEHVLIWKILEPRTFFSMSYIHIWQPLFQIRMIYCYKIANAPIRFGNVLNQAPQLCRFSWNPPTPTPFYFLNRKSQLKMYVPECFSHCVFRILELSQRLSFSCAGQIGPIVIKIYNINFNAYTEETQILFEIQGFYFFSNVISKRDVNKRYLFIYSLFRQSKYINIQT